jgi:hypothetical protein
VAEPGWGRVVSWCSPATAGTRRTSRHPRPLPTRHPS